MISQFCIERPIFAAVLSIVLVIAGLAARVAASSAPMVSTPLKLIASSQSAPVKRVESAASPPGKLGEDLMKMSMQGRDALLEVHRVRGIGGTQLRIPDSGWPARVSVRFRGFAALEAFTADAASGRLECMLQRPEKRAPEYVCRVGAERVDALSQREGVFLVALPARMLVPANQRITLRWVDQWR